MSVAQGYILPITDDLSATADRVVVYNTGTNSPATVWRDRERSYAFTNGTIPVNIDTTRYVTFFGDGIFDLEIQDSGGGILATFSGIAIRNEEPAYDGTTEGMDLFAVESQLRAGEAGAHTDELTSVVGSTLVFPNQVNQVWHLDLEGETVDTLLALGGEARTIVLYFKTTCTFLSDVGNMQLQTAKVVTEQGFVLVLQWIDGAWREISRSYSQDHVTNPASIVVGPGGDMTLFRAAPIWRVYAFIGTEIDNVYLYGSGYDIPEGTRVVFIHQIGMTYKHGTGNLRLMGDFTATLASSLELIAHQNIWYEVGRTITGAAVQNQVSVNTQAGESQGISLTNTARVVALKASGSAVQPATDVWWMTGGYDGLEITLIVQSTASGPDSTYLDWRVPVKSEANTAADGYFKLNTPRVGLIPGDALRVIRLTDSSGLYYWQEIQRTLADVEIEVKFLDTRDAPLEPPVTIEAWRPLVTVLHDQKSEKLKINRIDPDWIQQGEILQIRGTTATAFKMTEKQVSDGDGNIVCEDGGQKVTNDINSYIHFLRTYTPSLLIEGNREDPSDPPVAEQATAKYWLQLKTPNI